MRKMGKYTEVSFKIDSETTIDKGSPFEVAAKLVSALPSGNRLCVGIGYDEGPTDSVEIVVGGKSYSVGKGVLLYGCTDPNPAVGTVAVLPGSIKYGKAGSYTFSGVSGYSDGGFHEDDRITKTVTVSEAKAPPTTPTAPTVADWWLPLAIGGAIACIVAVAGFVILEEEKRSREMMMMMLMR